MHDLFGTTRRFAGFLCVLKVTKLLDYYRPKVISNDQNRISFYAQIENHINCVLLLEPTQICCGYPKLQTNPTLLRMPKLASRLGLRRSQKNTYIPTTKPVVGEKSVSCVDC